jgi:hypothetical protein
MCRCNALLLNYNETINDCLVEDAKHCISTNEEDKTELMIGRFRNAKHGVSKPYNQITTQR